MKSYTVLDILFSILLLISNVIGRGRNKRQVLHTSFPQSEDNALSTNHGVSPNNFRNVTMATNSSSATPSSEDWYSMLKSILNSPIDSLPGLQPFASQVQSIVSQSSGKTSSSSSYNQVATPSASSSLDGKSTCDTKRYVTLSATSLTALSGFYSRLDSFQTGCQRYGLQKTSELVKQTQISVSKTMLTVVQLTSLKEVTTCQLAPGDCEPGKNIQFYIQSFSQHFQVIQQTFTSESKSQTSAQGNSIGNCSPTDPASLNLYSSQIAINPGYSGFNPKTKPSSASKEGVYTQNTPPKFPKRSLPGSGSTQGFGAGSSTQQDDTTPSTGDGISHSNFEQGSGFSQDTNSDSSTKDDEDTSTTVDTNESPSTLTKKTSSQQSESTVTSQSSQNETNGPCSTTSGSSQSFITILTQTFTECQETLSSIEKVCLGLIGSNSYPSSTPELPDSPFFDSDTHPSKPSGSNYPSSESVPSGSASSSTPSISDGSEASQKCVCTNDSSTHLRIRSLEARIDSIHKAMKKRGLTDL
ncbi:hypothetical protein O181_066552 [Austropuccinia psidii MF-1]|uniref:Uncharacterized protein n=1 Tax=Austropuccinia psidii MF-1 TaxID=1389203 RepID=A0A9Q3EVN6_9BASI|nr:hypothetical protein [Austropuccinia psidii MF-1]